MTSLNDLETSADTPFGEVDLSNPLGSGSRVLTGAFMTAAGVAGGYWLFNQAKSFSGADSFNIPGSENL